MLEAKTADGRYDVIMLLAGDRRGRDVAAPGGGGMDGQGTPTGPDLEQSLAGAEVELLADALELDQLCLLERHAGVLEHRARVAHGGVEHAREERVAKVVVSGDVAPSP